MLAQSCEAAGPRDGVYQPGMLRLLVLARIAVDGGATRAGLVRDLTNIVAHKLSPGEWRARAADEVAGLIAEGLVSETRGRATVTERGRAIAEALLGATARATWAEVRDLALIGQGLGLGVPSAAQRRLLARPDGLRALVLQRAFGLPEKVGASASRLRAALAVVALERAFGNTIKRGIGTGSGLPAKAGRALAGQLSRRPQDFGSDGRLVAQLAAEQVGAANSDDDELRLAILRRMVTRALNEARDEVAPRPAMAAAGSALAALASAMPVATLPRALAANDTIPLATTPPAATRPDMAAFVAAVEEAARAHADGWPGNRKAFISHVWRAIAQTRPEWQLSEIEFKAMLSEAHRVGQVVLATADLKNKQSIGELAASAITYKNTVWHHVRVET